MEERRSFDNSYKSKIVLTKVNFYIYKKKKEKVNSNERHGQMVLKIRVVSKYQGSFGNAK